MMHILEKLLVSQDFGCIFFVVVFWFGGGGGGGGVVHGYT